MYDFGVFWSESPTPLETPCHPATNATSATMVPMKDNPQEIAEHLIEEHGLDGAVGAVMNGITEAHEQGDMYRLSVWRDVRRKLEAME